jgi:hypothetical protein
MMIGIISDTHGLLRPEPCERLAGVDHIIHTGDIGRTEVIAGLRELSPTTANAMPSYRGTAELTYDVADLGQRLAWAEGLGNITLATRQACLALAA